MKYQFNIVGERVIPTMKVNPLVLERPTAAVYRVKFDDQKGYLYLEQHLANFVTPKGPRYGGLDDLRQELVESYLANTASSTSCWAVGDPGTGKTLIAHDIANDLIDNHNRPVILIDSQLPFSAIREVAEACKPCMVFFEEFGKFYDTAPVPGSENSNRYAHSPNMATTMSPENKKNQAEILTLLDDTALDGVLFFLAANSQDNVNVLGVKGRPNRCEFWLDCEAVQMATYIDIIDSFGLPVPVRDLLLGNVLGFGYSTASPNWTVDSLRYLLTHPKIEKTVEGITRRNLIRNIPQVIPKAPAITLITEKEGEELKDVKLHYDGKTITGTVTVNHRTHEFSVPFDLLSTVREELVRTSQIHYNLSRPLLGQRIVKLGNVDVMVGFGQHAVHVSQVETLQVEVRNTAELRAEEERDRMEREAGSMMPQPFSSTTMGYGGRTRTLGGSLN